MINVTSVCSDSAVCQVKSCQESITLNHKKYLAYIHKFMINLLEAQINQPECQINYIKEKSSN